MTVLIGQEVSMRTTIHALVEGIDGEASRTETIATAERDTNSAHCSSLVGRRNEMELPHSV